MKLKRIVSLAVCILIVFSLPVVAFAEQPQGNSQLRYNEYFRVNYMTELWQAAPYSYPNINNSIVCYMDVGDTLFFYESYTDPYNQIWFRCKIRTCAAAPYLVGAYGYVLGSAVSNVVE